LKRLGYSHYEDRCISYHLTSGTTEEWMMRVENENPWVDDSPVNIEWFRGLLKESYRTIAAMRGIRMSHSRMR